jgi:hypothetical protein
MADAVAAVILRQILRRAHYFRCHLRFRQFEGKIAIQIDGLHSERPEGLESGLYVWAPQLLTDHHVAWLKNRALDEILAVQRRIPSPPRRPDQDLGSPPPVEKEVVDSVAMNPRT